MLDAIARNAKPADHPPADVLAAFAEHALIDRERDSVAKHLALCAECRDVVFLASGAADEVTTYSGELVAASRSIQTRPVTAYAAASMASPTKPEKLRRWWTSRLLWTASAAAVFVVVGGLVAWQRLTAPRVGQEIAVQSEPSLGNRYPEKAEPEKPSAMATPAAAPSAPKAKAQPTPQKATVPRAERVEPETSEVTALSKPAPAPPATKVQHAATARATATADSATISIGGPVPGAVATSPKASGFAPNTGQAQQQLDSLNATVSRALGSAAQRQHSNWRISPQGELEHFTTDGWTRVLADQPGTFRVVSVIGSEIWAGGNDGMLFHSADNGLRWKKVAVANAGVVENAALVSIRFSDSQNGEVVTDSGATYVTSDGGQTWTKH